MAAQLLPFPAPPEAQEVFAICESCREAWPVMVEPLTPRITGVVTQCPICGAQEEHALVPLSA